MSTSSSDSSSETGDTTRRIQLTPYFQRDYIVGVHDSFRFKVEVTDVMNMAGEIFVYLAKPRQPGVAEAEGFFSHIGTPSDIELHPVSEPYVNSDPKWFRLAYIDLLLGSRAEALELWDLIRADVTRLLTAYTAGETLTEAPPEWLPAAPSTDTGLSSSSSSLP
jgi:hypothetical protein